MAGRDEAPGRQRVRPRADERPFVMVLAGAKDGAPWAFRHLVEELGRPVAGYLRGQGAEDADGLTNEVFLKVFCNVERFSGDEGQFRSWVFTVARNTLLDDRRRRSRRVPTRDLADAVDHPSPRDSEPDAVTGANEQVRLLLGALTVDQREVILLRVAADLSVEETARVTRRTPEAVRALHHRALATLRRTIRA